MWWPKRTHLLSQSHPPTCFCSTCNRFRRVCWSWVAMVDQPFESSSAALSPVLCCEKALCPSFYTTDSCGSHTLLLMFPSYIRSCAVSSCLSSGRGDVEAGTLYNRDQVAGA